MMKFRFFAWVGPRVAPAARVDSTARLAPLTPPLLLPLPLPAPLSPCLPCPSQRRASAGRALRRQHTQAVAPPWPRLPHRPPTQYVPSLSPSAATTHRPLEAGGRQSRRCPRCACFGVTVEISMRLCYDTVAGRLAGPAWPAAQVSAAPVSRQPRLHRGHRSPPRRPHALPPCSALTTARPLHEGHVKARHTCGGGVCACGGQRGGPATRGTAAPPPRAARSRGGRGGTVPGAHVPVARTGRAGRCVPS